MSALQTHNSEIGTGFKGLNLSDITDSRGIPVLIAVAFLAAIWWVVSSFVADTGMATFIVAAAVIGGYMAMNIGANDVANNVAPAVGSGALRLGGAILIAAIFETAGALIAGGDVVSTISKGIIDPSLMPDSRTFILAMVSALVAAAVWLNLATWIGAPVSTTHSIVGGVIGVGIAAAGFGVVNWGTMSQIAASWFISPVLGGVIAAVFLAVINTTIFARQDMLAASRRWVPILVGIMAGAFAMYLTMKGLKRIWKADGWMVMAIGGAVFSMAVVALRPIVAKASMRIENNRKSVNGLFNVPLIFAAALLSFAHGANDVANAIGPVSAIIDAARSGEISTKVGIPLWVMMIGALGIALGLALFGTKMIKTVGRHLTALNQTRAFCVALSSAITVITASALALPVSSTHIAIGAIFGIGFYREYLSNSRGRAYTARVAANGTVHGDAQSKGLISVPSTPLIRPRKLVRRRHFLSIIAAWFITVPSAALLSSAVFFIIRAVFGS